MTRPGLVEIGAGERVRDDVDPETDCRTISLTVRLTPSSATEPLAAINGISAAGASKTKRTDSASGRRSTIRRQPVDMAGDEMPAQFVAEPQRLFEIDWRALGPAADRRARQRFGRSLHRKGALLDAITVRHGPEHAIEAPIAIAAVSKWVAMVSSASAPCRIRRTRPISVMMPVNIGARLRGRPPIYQPPFHAPGSAATSVGKSDAETPTSAGSARPLFARCCGSRLPISVTATACARPGPSPDTPGRRSGTTRARG